MRRPRREAPQLGLLALVALAATLLSVSAGTGGAGEGATRAAASAWRGLVGAPRQEVAVGQRVIVVLKTPSLADQVGRAGGRASEAQERQWNTAALAASHQLIARLAQDGVRVRPDFFYSHVFAGFAAAIDPQVLGLNTEAAERMRNPAAIEVVARAGHLFEEAGALERVAELAVDWFAAHLRR